MWPLLWMLIFLPFCLGTLNGFLGLPYAIRYIMDVAWVSLTVIILRYNWVIDTAGIKEIIAWILLFLSVTVVVYLVQYQSVFYYLWGFRNNFRYYAAFVAFATLLRTEEVEDSLKWFDRLFWLDIVLALIQYFWLGIEQDALGGIFGTAAGVNGSNNLFLLIIVTKAVVFYLDKKEKLRDLVLKSMAALLVAALAEMKFFFVEFAIVIVLAVLFTNFTWRKFFVLLGGGVAVVVFAAVLTMVFPNWDDWFSLRWFLETATSNRGYTGSGDLNRLTAIPRINELWLTEWPQRIFGKGLGNCDTASFSFVNTPFFRKYGDMHYNWMSYAIMYLECGWTGLVFYFGFFVLVYFAVYRVEKCSEGMVRSYCRISRITAIMCMIIAIYNSSLRAEAGYMACFILAIPFAMGRCQRWSTI